MLQIAALQDASSIQTGHRLVNPADTTNYRPVLHAPLVLVAWKERADVLWGKQPGDSLWRDLRDALVNPQGSAAYGQPDWGYVKFGHTDPLKSNSGYTTILLMTYGYHGQTSGLSAADILSNSTYQQWFLEIEASIGQFENSTAPLMKNMIVYGPSSYDFVAVYESTAIEQAENAVGRYGELRVYYPPATLWSDHPFCVLNADWVEPDQVKTDQLLLDYLTSQPAQELTLLKYGYCPVKPSIPLEQPGSPFDRYAANGFRANLSFLPKAQVPPGSDLNTLRDFLGQKCRQVIWRPMKRNFYAFFHCLSFSPWHFPPADNSRALFRAAASPSAWSMAQKNGNGWNRWWRSSTPPETTPPMVN